MKYNIKNESNEEDLKKSWDSRLYKLIKEKCGTQTKFANEFNTYCGISTITQPKVSNWVNVSSGRAPRKQDTDKAYDKKYFPDLNDAILLADFFDVSIDYLLGMTDYRNYDEAFVSEYLHLSPETVRILRNETDASFISPLSGIPNVETKKIINDLLKQEDFYRLIGSFSALEEAVKIIWDIHSNNEKLLSKYTESQIALAEKYIDATPQGIDLPPISEEIAEIRDVLINYENASFDFPNLKKEKINACKYRILQQSIQLIDAISNEYFDEKIHFNLSE